jgi:hypothetical protein
LVASGTPAVEAKKKIDDASGSFPKDKVSPPLYVESREKISQHVAARH